MNHSIITLGKFRVDEVLPFTGPKAPSKDFRAADGTFIKVKMRSLRYQTFRKGLVCVCCGIKGTYMALQRFPHEKEHQAHFNLYGLNQYGHPVLLTKDHIEPKSAGGKDHIDNMQTMCTVCNGFKKHHPLSVEQLKTVLEFYKELRSRRGPDRVGKKKAMKMVEDEIKRLLGDNTECASSLSPSSP